MKQYVQRDLEDQIMEEFLELQSKKIENNFSNHLETNLKTKSMTAPAATQGSPKKSISIKEVLDLLDKGFTRLAKFDRGEGSIQAVYGLTNSQVKELFEAPKLKGRKTKSVSVIAIDDAPGVVALTIKPKAPKAAKVAKPTPASATAGASPVRASTDEALFS
jgi:hypothetical protein